MNLTLNFDDIINEFNSLHKKPLGEYLEESAQAQEMSELEFTKRIALIITEEIKSRSAKARRLIIDGKLTATQFLAIKEAILEQMFYTINAGDYSLIIGFNPDQNSLVNLQELRARQFSPLAIKILKNAGLFYAGLDGRTMTPLVEGWWF